MIHNHYNHRQLELAVLLWCNSSRQKFDPSVFLCYSYLNSQFVETYTDHCVCFLGNGR